MLEFGKIRTRITPNTDTFYAVSKSNSYQIQKCFKNSIADFLLCQIWHTHPINAIFGFLVLARLFIELVANICVFVVFSITSKWSRISIYDIGLVVKGIFTWNFNRVFFFLFLFINLTYIPVTRTYMTKKTK